MPTHPTTPNPVFATYKLECTHPGCKGKVQIDQAQSSGLRVGDIVPADPGDFSFGRCPMCKRTMMRVVSGPPTPKKQPPKGFTKVPTE